MNSVYLLIGGNIGDRLAQLNLAKNWIMADCGKIEVSSSIYETAAWGITEQAPFYNQALAITTHLNPTNLMQALLAIEIRMGRIRTLPLGPRIIDLDIIYFNNEIIELPNLSIPHPRLKNRRFVLAPLVEIAPAYLHPILLKTNSLLLKECGDYTAVHKK